MNDLEESLLKAHDNLESAKALLEIGFEEEAVNRTYYAYFGLSEGYYQKKTFL